MEQEKGSVYYAFLSSDFVFRKRKKELCLSIFLFCFIEKGKRNLNFYLLLWKRRKGKMNRVFLTLDLRSLSEKGKRNFAW